jgi:hypothetical protein
LEGFSFFGLDQRLDIGSREPLTIADDVKMRMVLDVFLQAAAAPT